MPDQPPKLSMDWLSPMPTQTQIGVDLDHYRLFCALKARYASSYLFESLALPRHQDRYFSMGFDPAAEFIAKGDSLRIIGKPNVIEKLTGRTGVDEVNISGVNPHDYLRDNLPLRWRSATHQGGLIGYYCYESVNYFEPAIKLKEHADYPTFHLGLYTDGLIFDTETDIAYYYTYAEDRLDQVRAAMAEAPGTTIPTRLEAVEVIGNTQTAEEHTKAVANTLEEVRAGNTFQCEVGFKTLYQIKGDKLAIYTKLREVNPSPYMFYVIFGEYELLGASPEILATSVDGSVLTTPTAGTRRRGSSPAEDKALSRELLTDAKEIAEHNMLVDLHRNDLARVCKIGSVKVADLMYLIRFSHVQHIVSNIVGDLAPDKTAYDLLAAILPGGVLTGAPKIETIKIIDRNENLPRGPYGGAVGRFSFNGDCAFAMPIRSLFCKGDDCFTQTCSGVVLDSDPDMEYAEITHKLAAMRTTIEELKPC